MAKFEFINNVRIAATFLDPRVQTDSHQIDTGNVESVLRRAVLWLTPTSVDGFRRKDFRELPPNQLQELERNVEVFRQVAEAVPPDKPATRKQIDTALPAFLKVVEIVSPYFWSDPDTRRVLDVLEAVPFPAEVVGFDYQLDVDSTGDPALYITVSLDDATAADGSFDRKAAEVLDLIYKAVFGARLNRWPYITFRLASDQRDLSAKGKR